MTKKTFALIKPAIVLTVICIVAAILLAVVNLFAAPVIERVEKEKRLATLSVVFADATDFEELSLTGAPKAVTAVYKESTGKGHVLLCETETGFDTLTFSIGVDTEGKITGIKLTSVFYSAGDSGKENAIANLIHSYVGQKNTENATKVSGATDSSDAMRTAVNEALDYAKALREGQ